MFNDFTVADKAGYCDEYPKTYVVVGQDGNPSPIVLSIDSLARSFIISYPVVGSFIL